MAEPKVTLTNSGPSLCVVDSALTNQRKPPKKDPLTTDVKNPPARHHSTRHQPGTPLPNFLGHTHKKLFEFSFSPTGSSPPQLFIHPSPTIVPHFPNDHQTRRRISTSLRLVLPENRRPPFLLDNDIRLSLFSLPTTR